MMGCQKINSSPNRIFNAKDAKDAKEGNLKTINRKKYRMVRKVMVPAIDHVSIIAVNK